MSKKGIIVAGGAAAVVAPEAVDFDAANDYLSKSSDLTGNTDRMTFTFSAWIYYGTVSDFVRLYSTAGNYTYITYDSHTIDISMGDSSNGSVLSINGPNFTLALETWHHILISIDTYNPANRHVYFNDVDMTGDFTWATYAEESIDFTRTAHSVGASTDGAAGGLCRIAHVYLDYIHRDLRIEANRRFFITSNLRPVEAVAIGGQTAAGSYSPALLSTGIGGTEFDGTADYLNRGADLTGNANGKVFTLSFWCFRDYVLGTQNIIHAAGEYFQCGGERSKFNMSAKNTGGTTIFGMNTSASSLTADVWHHFLISVDLTSTSRRSCYVDGVLDSTSWNIYTNADIDFTRTEWTIGRHDSGAFWNGRLAHVYLDYTYRDLSTKSNRDLFINDDGTPNETGMDSLSPIIYLKMKDGETTTATNSGSGGNFTVNSGPLAEGSLTYQPILHMALADASTAHINSGSGGNFTLNGTVALSGRGPNQYNSPASTFDGSGDYMSNASLTGTSTGKQFTTSFNIRSDTASLSLETVFTNSALHAYYSHDDQVVEIQCRDVSTTGIAARARLNNFNATNRQRHIDFSVDVDGADTAKRHIYVDGVIYTDVTWENFADIAIGYTNNPWNVGAGATSSPPSNSYFEGAIGDLWMDDVYIDLSADNPFYDTDTGKPKDLGVDGSTPTGSSPLIYLPLRGNDAGDNRGTGGDFTVNSGPYTGARGPSEFWAGSAEFNGTTQRLLRTSDISGATSNKTVTIAISIYLDDTAGYQQILYFDDRGAGTDADVFQLQTSGLGGNFDATLRLFGESSDTTQILSTSDAMTLSSGAWINILISLDMSDTGKRWVYKDGVAQSPTWGTYTNATYPWAACDRQALGDSSFADTPFNGKIGFLYFSNVYTDFSDESNRLKFFDAFGYPVDLGSDGSNPSGTAPLMYLYKDVHLGADSSGNGNNFTPVNTPTDGGHVKG